MALERLGEPLGLVVASGSAIGRDLQFACRERSRGMLLDSRISRWLGMVHGFSLKGGGFCGGGWLTSRALASFKPLCAGVGGFQKNLAGARAGHKSRKFRSRLGPVPILAGFETKNTGPARPIRETMRRDAGLKF